MSIKFKLRAISAKARADGSADHELLIYGDIGESWFGDSVTAKGVVEQLQGLQAQHILVRINSYGGSVTDGIAIYNALRATGAKITTRVEGIAASIASLIAMAGDTLEMSANTLMMIHAPWTMAAGNSADMREMADVLDVYAQAMSTSYARKSGKPLQAELDQLMDGVDHWLTAEQAKEAGYCDTIIDEAAPEQTAARAAMFEPVIAALARYRSAPTAIAASYTPFIKAALRRTPPPAAAAATRKEESTMNWKNLAQAMGITVGAEDTDAQILAAIAKKLGLAEGADAAAVTTALATRNAPAVVAAAVTAAPAAAAEPTRRQQVEELFEIAAIARPTDTAIAAMRASALIGNESVDAVRAKLQAHLANGAQPVAGAYNPTVVAGDDVRDKRRAAMSGWLLVRAAVAKRDSAEARDVNANPYRGMSFHDLARACLEDSGFNVRGMNRHDMISAAITHSTSDFPNIFENALHKTLLSGFTVAPTTWDKVCRIGALSDFRPHLRYRSSSIGDLEVIQENGEYKTLVLSDAERESIVAKARGGIINVTREMLVNDDMGVFTSLAMDLGKSAARTREKALYTLLALNGGAGPTMGDGKALFHVDHGNISTHPGAPTVEIIDQDRQQMAMQMDVGGNDFLDIRPSIWLGPLSLGGNVRVINGSQYDPDTPNKLQKPNKVNGLYNQVIDTPRLSGTAHYSLSDPNAEPVFEMGFVDGQQSPQIATEEAFTQNGMKWRVADEWGMAAIGYRGGIKNNGA